MAAAFEDWRLPQGESKGMLTPAVARQPSALPVLDPARAAGGSHPSYSGFTILCCLCVQLLQPFTASIWVRVSAGRMG